MVPYKIKILTLEYGLLWNTIILKSEPPYCAFTLQLGKRPLELKRFIDFLDVKALNIL
jgi:hypothetical protein